MKYLLRYIINLWITLTGKSANTDVQDWLKGPMGDSGTIGSQFYEAYAKKMGLDVQVANTNGLMQHFMDAFEHPNEVQHQIASEIVGFYEHTASYKLEVWSQWYQPVKFFAHLLIKLLSPQMDQLNIPLSPLETSRGMSNEVIALRDKNGNQTFACWLRKTISTKRVVYSGFYSIVKINQHPFVRVVFPLPKGNVTVILRVIAQEDGSVKLLSDGKQAGAAGYYRIKDKGANKIKFKFVPLKESIHVFVDEFGTLRTDHIFWFLGMKFLHLHYKMIKQNAAF